MTAGNSSKRDGADPSSIPALCLTGVECLQAVQNATLDVETESGRFSLQCYASQGRIIGAVYEKNSSHVLLVQKTGGGSNTVGREDRSDTRVLADLRT